MLEARVREEYRWDRVNACGGVEFVKSEWRPVPPGMEEAARVYKSLLEIRERGAEPDLREPDEIAKIEEREAASIADVLIGNVKTVIARIKESEAIETLVIAGGYEKANKKRKTVLAAITKRISELMAEDDKE